MGSMIINLRLRSELRTFESNAVSLMRFAGPILLTGGEVGSVSSRVLITSGEDKCSKTFSTVREKNVGRCGPTGCCCCCC